jgi:hypothetical protein
VAVQVQKVTDAVALVKQQRPELLVEGPIQYDAAIDPAVAAVKIKAKSEVAGQATVFVFPDLNTGNNTYKAVQQVGTSSPSLFPPPLAAFRMHRYGLCIFCSATCRQCPLYLGVSRRVQHSHTEGLHRGVRLNVFAKHHHARGTHLGHTWHATN